MRFSKLAIRSLSALAQINDFEKAGQGPLLISAVRTGAGTVTCDYVYSIAKETGRLVGGTDLYRTHQSMKSEQNQKNIILYVYYSIIKHTFVNRNLATHELFLIVNL